MHISETKFEFVPPEDSTHINPWKESFRQNHSGVHVRQGYNKMINSNPRKYKGRNHMYFDTIGRALTACDDLGMENPLIFVHTGTYHNEYVMIDSDVRLIGASSGNVAENVIIERENESSVMFMEGAKSAYLGYVTIKFSPDITSSMPHKHYCLEVGQNCSPTVDHCIIRSSSNGTLNITLIRSLKIFLLVTWIFY